mmetsp:Transcript_11/g.9  ORF Transcript_11/g.9 Transcript_11/m.9 type:complete len:89 (-) Transcript_11:101-367(-)
MSILTDLEVLLTTLRVIKNEGVGPGSLNEGLRRQNKRRDNKLRHFLASFSTPDMFKKLDHPTTIRTNQTCGSSKGGNSLTGVQMHTGQ